MVNRILSRAYFTAFMVMLAYSLASGQSKVFLKYSDQDGIKKASVIADVQPGEEIEALTLRIDYPEQVQVYSVERGRNLPFGLYSSNPNYQMQNAVAVGWAGWQNSNVNPIKQKVTVCEITFDLKENVFSFDKNICEAANSSMTILTIDFIDAGIFPETPLKSKITPAKSIEIMKQKLLLINSPKIPETK